ncbi:DUF1302 family protein [Desulfosoma sp.]|uniref:DUF1302 family protein n=1 Tax=Desulfosoma sp. TaxID=2603217 RepID=UPI0040499217
MLALLLSSRASASAKFDYALHTSRDAAFFQLRGLSGLAAIRSFVLDRPRRYVVDLPWNEPVPLTGPRSLRCAEGSPVEKIRIAPHPSFLRLVFYLTEGEKILRNVQSHGSSILFSFKDTKVSSLVPFKTASTPGAPPPFGMVHVTALPSSGMAKEASFQSFLPPKDSPSGLKPTEAAWHEPPRVSPNTPSTHSPTAAASHAFGPPEPDSSAAGARFLEKTHVAPRAFLWHAARLTGFLEMRGAADTDRDNAMEHTRSFRQRFHLATKVPLRENQNNLFAQVSARSDLLWFGTASDWNDWNLDFHEAYLHWSDASLEMRLGKQIVRWGKTDQLSPLDMVNPEDLREGITWDMEERKIPVWMARLRAFRGPLALEGVAVPFFEPHDIHLLSTDWAVFRHLKGAVAADPQAPPAVKDALGDIAVHRREPSRTAHHAQWGTRVTAQSHGWDLAVSYFDGFDPSPHLENFPVKNIHSDGTFSRESLENALLTGVLTQEDLEVRYKRFRMIGVDFETTYKSLGLRGETAYFSHRSFLTDSLTSTTHPVFDAVLGADYEGANGWYVNFQIGYRRIGGAMNRTLYFQRENISLNGEISKELLRGDLQARLRYLVMLTDGGSYWNPSLTVLRFRPLSLALGLNLFAGPADTFMGSYGDNDQYYVQCRYDF